MKDPTKNHKHKYETKKIALAAAKKKKNRARRDRRRRAKQYLDGSPKERSTPRSEEDWAYERREEKCAKRLPKSD